MEGVLQSWRPSSAGGVSCACCTVANGGRRPARQRGGRGFPVLSSPIGLAACGATIRRALRAFVNVMLLVVGWGPRLLLIPSLSCADTAAGGEGPYSRSRAMRRAISGHPMHSRDESHRLICQWSARAGPLAWASAQVVGTMLNRTACVKQHDAPGSGRR